MTKDTRMSHDGVRQTFISTFFLYLVSSCYLGWKHQWRW